MGHPIDDIFRDGLSHQKHAPKQGDWLKAKDMLDLEKRKRRFPIWWFGIAAGLLLGAMMIPMFYMGQAGTTDDAAIGAISLEQDSKIKEVDKVTDSYITADSEETDQKNNAIKEENKDTQEVNENNALPESNTSNNTKNQLTAEQKNAAVKNAQLPFSTSQNSTVNSKDGARKGDGLVLDKSGLSEEETIKSLSGNLVNYSGTIDSKPNTTESVIELEDKDQIKQSPALISIAYLSQVIGAFDSRIKLPQIEDHRLTPVLEHKEVGNPWSLNIYTAYTVPDAKPSLGFILNRDISSKWSSSIGIGVNYFRKNDLEFTGELEVVDANGFRQLSDVSETLSFQQFSLELPLNIGYRIRRHSILAIAIAEINLWSELTRNSTVSNADILEMDPASPNMSLSDPITLMQNAKTINEAALSAPKYYVGIGYGYDVSQKFALQVNGLCKVSTGSNENISTSLTSTQSDFLNESNWLLRTSLLFRF